MTNSSKFLLEYSQNFHKIFDKDEKIEEIILENILNKSDLFTPNCKNLSNISTVDILKSASIVEFLNEYLNFEPSFNEVKHTINSDNLIKAQSVFPFIADFSFCSNEEDGNVDSLLVVKLKINLEFKLKL